MRKNDLIAYLSTIPGNPRVAVWNGFVDDFMLVKQPPKLIGLVKETVEFLSRIYDADIAQRLGREPTEAEKAANLLLAEQRFEQAEWDMANPEVQPDEVATWYGSRRSNILLFYPELRGKSTYDRMGDIEY